MIEVDSRKQPSAALMCRCLSTGIDEARSRAALGQPSCRAITAAPRPFCLSRLADSASHPVDRFPDRRSMHLGNKPPASKSPWRFDASPRHTSRGFLLWRFADAGPSRPPHHHHRAAIRKPCMGPPLSRDASRGCIGHGRLFCSVALSGQSPGAACGAPKARGLTANAQTELP
jgi:hypothetical protein